MAERPSPAGPGAAPAAGGGAERAQPRRPAPAGRGVARRARASPAGKIKGDESVRGGGPGAGQRPAALLTSTAGPGPGACSEPQRGCPARPGVRCAEPRYGWAAAAAAAPGPARSGPARRGPGGATSGGRTGRGALGRRSPRREGRGAGPRVSECVRGEGAAAGQVGSART